MEITTKKDQVLDTLSKLPNLSNKELYALYPKIDQGSIRNYKHLFKKDITNDENEQNLDIVITPGPSKKSKVYINPKVKEGFQVGILDPKLIEMKDSELIRHTCREIIATKNYDPRLRLQASTLLLNFADKTGDIKSFVPSARSLREEKFRSMPIKDLVKIVSATNNPRNPSETFNMNKVVATGLGIDESEIEAKDYTPRDHTLKSRDKQLSRADDKLFITEGD